MSERPFTKETLDLYLKELAKEFQEEYPGVTNTDNVNEIIAAIRKKQGR